MRALATSRFVVFVTRRAGAFDFAAARSFGRGFQVVAERTLGAVEAASFIADLRRAGVEVVEVSSPREETFALPAPRAAAEIPTAPARFSRPVESDWLSFSKIVLETQKIRGPNAR